MLKTYTEIIGFCVPLIKAKKHVWKLQILVKSSLQNAMSFCLCHRQKTCNMKALFQPDSSLKNLNSRHIFWTISSPFFTPLQKPLRRYYNILENKILAPAGIPFSKIPPHHFFPSDTDKVSWENGGKKNHQFSCCGYANTFFPKDTLTSQRSRLGYLGLVR